MKSFFLFEVEDTTGGAVDVAIFDPALAGPGSEILVRDRSDGSNAVTVTPDAGTIDGSSSATVPAGGILRLLSDGATWMDVSPSGGGGGEDPRWTDGTEVDSVLMVSATGVGLQSQNGGVSLSATGGNFNAISQDGDAQIASGAGGGFIRCASDGSMILGCDPAKPLSFFDGNGAVRVVMATGAGHTVDNLITALQNLGLFKQS